MTRNFVSTFLKTLGFVAGALCVATAVFADEDMMIEIKFGDGDGLKGLLIAKDEDSIRVATEFMGIVTVPVSGSSCIGAACPENMKPKDQVLPAKPATTGASVDNAAYMTAKPILASYSFVPDLGEIQEKSKLVSCQGCYKSVAAPVTRLVTLKRGSVTIEGTLSGMEPDAYILNIDKIGEVRVASSYECSGHSCPTY